MLSVCYKIRQGVRHESPNCPRISDYLTGVLRAGDDSCVTNKHFCTHVCLHTYPTHPHAGVDARSCPYDAVAANPIDLPHHHTGRNSSSTLEGIPDGIGKMHPLVPMFLFSS